MDGDNKENSGDMWVSELIDLVKKQSKHRLMVIFLILALWAVTLSGTIAGFLWYLNQYDFVSYEQDGNGNNYMNSEIEGNVHNGTEASSEEEEEPE